jgi:hypothetical protein
MTLLEFADGFKDLANKAILVFTMAISDAKLATSDDGLLLSAKTEEEFGADRYADLSNDLLYLEILPGALEADFATR